MTVSSLIALLKTCPPESHVIFSAIDEKGKVTGLYDDDASIDVTNSDDALTWVDIARV